MGGASRSSAGPLRNGSTATRFEPEDMRLSWHA